jgi:hypothetical protein
MMTSQLTFWCKPISLAVFCAFLSGAANANADWPSHGDLLERGMPLPTGELSRLLEGNTAVVVFTAGAAAFGRVFSCGGDASILFEFIPPATSSAADPHKIFCEIVDSSICFGREGGDWRHCLAVRRVSDSEILFTGMLPSGPGGISDDEFTDLRESNAHVLGILPTDVRTFESPEGEIEFGPVAFSLPADPVFVLHAGAGLPLGLTFGEGRYGGIVVETRILGWPDAMAQNPAAQEPQPSDPDRAGTELAEWEERYRSRRLGNYMGDEQVASLYESTWLDFPAGPCVRIREHISIVPDTEESSPALPRSASLRQTCISPSSGAFLMVSADLKDPDNADELAAFEEVAGSILGSLRLGFEQPE